MPGGSPRWVRFVLTWMLLFVVAWLLFIGPWGDPWHNFKGTIKEKSTAKMAVETAGAISSFYADYDRLPINSPDADWVGTTGEKNGLVAVLTAAEKPDGKLINPKRINFLDGFKPAKKDDSGKMAYGIDDVTNPWDPAIYDPWGQPFIVIMDTDKDGVIANPLKSWGALLLRGKKGIVYSTGPPNADGSRNTDESKFITSW